MSGFKATLGGVALPLLQPIGWGLRNGTSPYQRLFEMHVDDAASLKGPILDIALVSGDREIQASRLHVVSVLPGSRFDTRAVLVADRRLLWSRIGVAYGFNVRRRTGDTRLVGEGRVETLQVVDDGAYASWSLNGGAAWKWQDALAEVFKQAGEPVRIALKDPLASVVVENLEFSGTFDLGLQLLLSYAPAAAVYIDLDGVAVVHDTRQGGERDELKKLTPAIYGTGSAAMSDRRYARPSAVFVGFEREVEIRFDYSEDEPTEAATVARNPAPSSGVEARVLENVFPSPDLTLAFAGQTITRGTWVAFDAGYTAWEADGTRPAGTPGPLNAAKVRRHWTAQFAMLRALYGVDGSGNPSMVKINRLRAIRQHWRQTFRIPAPWMARFRSIRAERVALIDQETGTRGRNSVFTDYTVKASMFGLAKRQSDYHKLGWLVRGYATLLADAEQAPALLTVLDPDSGIIRVDFQTDPAGEGDEIAPGAIDEGAMPTHDATSDILAWYACSLESAWKLAMVFSAVQASPNNVGRYHMVKVEPGQTDVKTGECLGPPMTVLVGGGLTTARFAWDDARSAEIDGCFGRGDPITDDLCVNKLELGEVAKAIARSEYLSLLDRMDGSYSGALTDVKPNGSISLVEHQIGTGGIATTFVAMPPELPRIDFQALLPQSVQRTLRRLVQP